MDRLGLFTTVPAMGTAPDLFFDFAAYAGVGHIILLANIRLLPNQLIPAKRTAKLIQRDGVIIISLLRLLMMFLAARLALAARRIKRVDQREAQIRFMLAPAPKWVAAKRCQRPSRERPKHHCIRDDDLNEFAF
jgi:hypothetical protein